MKKMSKQNWHGFLGNPDWEEPVMTQHCDVEARPGYKSEKAHEYEDHKHVLHEKVVLLADLIKRSRNCLIYSGAGISTSSGISDYATKSNTKFAPKKKSGFDCKPTFSHKALVIMQQAGLVKHWVQQNHDGLPQKAGLPQECINEIHGAWYDPTNPVVPMSGSLRDDLFNDLMEWEEKADLTLSLGTSMCGMNADRVFTTVAEKSISDLKREHNNDRDDSNISLGGVIIGIQKTQYDNLACLHIFDRIDNVMELLLQALDLQPPPSTFIFYEPNIPNKYKLGPEKYISRYNNKGFLCAEDEPGSCLDLSPNRFVKMVSGPYKGDRGRVIGKMAEGHYKLEFVHTLDYRRGEIVEPYKRVCVLGRWYVEAAIKGSLPEIPVVNCE
jgi:NAD-dependent SIR2 family protein deacetylase